jgi:hypothetical protein
MNQEDISKNLYTTFFILFMIIYSYFKAHLTSPMQTNVDKYFSIDTNERSISIVDINVTQYPTSCEFCNIKKFERTSHCRVCKICVLRRDHHCIWIGNCVGYKNTQYFFNFCFWVVVKLNKYSLELVFSYTILSVIFLTIKKYVKLFLSFLMGIL